MRGKAKVFEEVIAAQKGRIILWLPVMLGAGSALYFALRFEPPWALAGGLLAVLLLATGLVWPLRMRDARTRTLWLTLVTALWVAAGFGAAMIRTALVAGPLLEREIRVTQITGTVEEVEILEAGVGQRVILGALTIEKLPPEKTPHRVRLKIRDGETVPVGARVTALGSLNPPSPPVMPGSFDFQRFAFYKRIGAFGFTFGPLEILSPVEKPGIVTRIEQLRQDIVARLDEKMDARESAIAAALMIGERGAVTDADWEAMRISGLAHMLSISGMHVGLVAAVVFFAVRLMMAAVPSLALRVPIKKYAAFIALLAAAFYTGLAVPSVPSYRSLLMSGIVLVAVMMDRKAFSMRTIAIAAIVVLLITPEAVWSASFQMSFAATAALIFFFEETAPHWGRWRRNAGPWRRGLLYVGAVCMTTVAAGTATAPYGIYHFQQFPVYSVLANFLAVPVLSFIVMPAIVLAFPLMPLGWEGPVLWIMQAGIALINRIAYDVTALPLSQIVVPGWPLAAMLLFSAGIIALMIWGGRSRYLLAGLLLLASAVSVVVHRAPDIVVAADGQLMAVRLADGRLSLSTARKDKFTAGIWLRRYGFMEDNGLYWPREGEGPGGMMCDREGCRVTVKERKIAFSFVASAFAEDCAWADIVIARVPTRGTCEAPVVVDRSALKRRGAHTVTLSGDVVSVQDERGRRPWTVSQGR